MESISKQCQTLQKSLDGVAGVMESIAPSVIAVIQKQYSIVLEATQHASMTSLAATADISTFSKSMSQASTQTNEVSHSQTDAFGIISFRPKFYL